jgi:hypothetical protein
MTTHRPALTRLATRTIDIHNGVVQHPADHPQPLERTSGQVPGSVR